MDIVVRRYLPDDLRRASHGDDVRRNVLRDDGARADDRIIPDMYPSQNSDVGRDPHVMADVHGLVAAVAFRPEPRGTGCDAATIVRSPIVICASSTNVQLKLM